MSHADLVDEPHYIYRCYDADNRLIYIGCTTDVEARMANHANAIAGASQLLRAFMTRYEVGAECGSRAAGRRAEREAIAAEQPLFNTYHKGQPAWQTARDVDAYLRERGWLLDANELRAHINAQVDARRSPTAPVVFAAPDLATALRAILPGQTRRLTEVEAA